VSVFLAAAGLVTVLMCARASTAGAASFSAQGSAEQVYV
jgi:hypothetical protein